MLKYYEESSSSLGKPNYEGDEDPYEFVFGMVKDKLNKLFPPAVIAAHGPQVEEALRTLSLECYEDYGSIAIKNHKRNFNMPREEFIASVFANMFGLGPIQELIKDPSIEDIVINGPTEVMAYKNGDWAYYPEITYKSSLRLIEQLNANMAKSGRGFDETKPIADALLPTGERISVVMHPISNPNPVAVMRIARTRDYTLEDFIKPYRPPGMSEEEATEMRKKELEISIKETPLPDYSRVAEGGLLSKRAARYLHAAVLMGLNIVIIGPTGVGKTSLLQALGKIIPIDRRVLIIEDTPEIVLRPGADRPHNVISLRTRPHSLDGAPPISQADLIKLALRSRPDALTVGEARGEEMFDLLNALNTGHKNGLTSLHTDSVADMFSRILTMLAQSERGRTMNEHRAATMVGSNLHIVICLKKVGNIRLVDTICEMTGQVSGTGSFSEPDILPIFKHSGNNVAGFLDGPIRETSFMKKFVDAGFNSNVFSLS